MREAVIVVADLYLDSRQLSVDVPEAQTLPALAHAGRFGERERLEDGWRSWLVRWLGRPDLAGVAVAEIAAAPLGASAAGPRWIATPVELVAGLARVHLDRRGIVRLAPAEQATLVAAFERTFAGAGLGLAALGDGQLLLTAPGTTPVTTTEPARRAGAELEVPQGPAAAPLLRLMGEIEMWLHGEPLNDARRARGVRPVTGLWLWGALGDTAPAPCAAHTGSTLAFGSDAFLAGLCHLGVGRLQLLPAELAAVFADPAADRVVLVIDIAGESTAEEPWSLAAAAAALDRRVISPALAALRQGSLERLSLIANDARVSLGRHSNLKRWRRARAGLAAFA